jgi:HK97 family phage portal protein
MRILGRLFDRKSTVKMTSAELSDLIRQGGGTSSGVVITPKQALQATTALACGRVVGNGLGQVPFKLYQKVGRSRKPATWKRLYRLLYLKPNDWMTSFELRQMIGFHRTFCGEAFVWKNTVNGEIVELLPIPPECMETVRDGWSLRYFMTDSKGKRQEIPASEMWHIRSITWDGFKGMEPVRLAREAIGLGLAAEAHGSTMFANGMAIPGVLHSTQSLTDDQRKAIRKSIEETHTGSNKFRMMLTWGGLQYTPSASTNEASQYLELRRFQVEETCRGLGVMPIMVYSSDKTQAYASVEAMFQAHFVHTMGPLYTSIEQSAMCNLLTEQELDEGYYIRFTVNALMHATAKDKADYLNKMWSMGARSPNEIREMDELDPYEGGDTFRVPMNTEDPANPGQDNSDALGDGNATP